jgi:hypothetical protein
MFALSADVVKKIMKYFKEVGLPVFKDVAEEMYRLIKSETIHWHNGQICLNSTADQPDNFKLGVGSLQYDWDNMSEEIGPIGDITYVVPLRDIIIHEYEFIVLCTQFKNTIFEDIYNTVSEKYRIGRARLMKSESKTCLSWHTDPGHRLHYPIKTQEGCSMVIEDEVCHLKQDIWYITSTNHKHTAFNASLESRIHLVFDLLDNYDKVN